MSTLRIAVLDDYQQVARELADWNRIGPDAAVDFFHDHLTDLDALVEHLAGYDVICIMRERTPFGRPLLERLPRLRLLVTTGMRNAAIDLGVCAERGITVCGTPSHRSGTSELAWGLILALLRHIPTEDRAIRRGRWQTTIGEPLAGKTLGILGLGHLGSNVARVGLAFDMRVIAWSQNLTAERAAAVGVELVDKDALFASSDVLTIHLVLGERTRGLVGQAELARMKPTAYLVNTSRAPIVDREALLDALRSGRIAGAGIDVYATEPLPPDDPILSAPHTVLTPHIGYVVREGYETFYRVTVDDVVAWRAGAPINVIAPSKPSPAPS